MTNKTRLVGVNKSATGARIKQLMQIRDTNITEVSRIMGLTYQCIYRWIKGETFPDIDNLVILSKVLRVKLETILVLYGEENVIEYSFLARIKTYFELVEKNMAGLHI